jgi:hypothetical protein
MLIRGKGDIQTKDKQQGSSTGMGIKIMLKINTCGREQED